MSAARGPRRVPEAVHRELADGEAVILRPDGSLALVLNPMGAVVWELCDGRPVEAIVALICEQLAAERAVVLRDVEQLLQQLDQAGLLLPVGAD